MSEEINYTVPPEDGPQLPERHCRFCGEEMKPSALVCPKCRCWSNISKPWLQVMLAHATAVSAMLVALSILVAVWKGCQTERFEEQRKIEYQSEKRPNLKVSGCSINSSGQLVIRVSNNGKSLASHITVAMTTPADMYVKKTAERIYRPYDLEAGASKLFQTLEVPTDQRRDVYKINLSWEWLELRIPYTCTWYLITDCDRTYSCQCTTLTIESGKGVFNGVLEELLER